jgi:hypothetical protein
VTLCAPLAAALLLAAASALAGGQGQTEAEVEAKARAELELQLKRMTRMPPPSLEIRFEGIDSSRYELLEATFALDGTPLKTQPPHGIGEKKASLLLFDIVSPGEHVVTATLAYKEVAPDGFFSYGGYKFTLPGRFTVTAQNGLVMVLRAWVEVNDGAPDTRQRLELVASAEPRMVARMADDSTPAPAADDTVKIRGSWRSNATVTGEPMSPQKDPKKAPKKP